MLDARQVPQQDAVRVQRALRLARRAARIDDDGGIFGPRVGGLEIVRGARQLAVEIERARGGPGRAKGEAPAREALPELLDLPCSPPGADDGPGAAVLHADTQRCRARERAL